VLANEAAAAVHGLSVEQLEGASDEQFGFESDQRDFESDDMHVIDSGEPVHVAGDRFVDADGAEHVVETEILPLETEIDDRRALVVTTDITEQKALEADLKASQNRLRQVIDMLPQLVFAKDETGEFLLANEAVADAYGTTVDELEGATDADFAESPAEAEQFRADDRAVIASGEPQHIPEESMTTADGRRRTFETTKIPYDPVDAAGDAVLGVATDITERKQQEAELEVQVAAMETSMDGISILNADDEYIYMNQAHADVFDYEPGDLLGGSWRQVYDDDELERLEQDVFPRLDRDGEWRGETVGVRRDGSPVHLEITLSVLDDGKLICTNRDISERKQRERELERYEALVESMEEAAFVVDSAGQLEYANEASLSHAATTFDEIDSKSVVALARELAADDAEIGPFERGLEAALRGESVPERYELRTDSPDDAQVMEYTFSPFSSAGDPKVAVVARDVTERRVRERELERQRSRLRALFDDSPDSIIVHDADGRVLDANETQVELLGYDRERLLSMNVAAFEVGHSRSELQAVWDDMAVGDTLKIEGNHRRSNGSIYPVEMWVARTEVAHEQRFVAVSRDISERKDRESELERNREFLERAQESASVGGWEIDFAADDLRWSDEVYRIHDLPLDADVSVADGLDYYHPDDRQTITDAFERLRTDGESYDLELRIVTADDTLRWVRTIADPRFDENGETIGAIGVFQDITERKERERDLQELTERLDLAVKGAGLAVWDWDMRTDDVTFNDQWASMLGLSPGDVEPTLESWEERVHPDDMDRVESALEAHMSGEAPLYDCEHRMLTASGDWKWIRDVGEVVERDASGEPARAVGIHIDISEQKATEQSLGAERDMFAQGPAVVFNWRNDDGWPVEYVSDNVSETFGYTPEELESGTVPYETLIHEDDAERVTAEVAAHSDETTERFSHDPYRMVTASGEVKWVKDNTKIIRKDGEITHYLGYLIDITDRKQLEESLRQSEQSIREITEIASDTERDFQEKLEAVLELGCERLGLPFGFLTRITGETQHITEAIGTHPLIQPGESAPLSKAYCRQTIEQDEILDVADALDEGWGDDPAYETFGLGCYIGGKVLVDGDLYGTLCFADRTSRPHEFDETQRAFVELLVQWISYELASDAVESKLRQLNETARELIATGDRDEIATIATQRPKSVLDLPVTGIWWYDESADALVPAGMTDEAASVIGEQPTFEGGNSLTWQAFEEREILVYDDLETAEGRHNEQTSLRSEVIVPLGEHGVLVSGSTQPLAFSETDRRLFEVLSATVEDALYRAEREEVLRETRERLEQSNEELEQFAYAASHDLQEPLRTISSYLTLLERRYRADLSDDAIEFVDLAVDGADRMRDMIQALLEYSRVDTRGGGFEPTEMSSVFDQIQRNLTVTIDETSATVDVPADPGTVMGDENQLVQLFQNLVENGIKYSEDDRRVDVSAERRDGVLEYAVADNGIGMELDQRDGIFEVFQRLHTREEFEGTGIGLSICRKIVDRHDGDIRVESTPGTGSTFYVTLPTETDHGD
jgi:PAS domain S-box-containing protein